MPFSTSHDASLPIPLLTSASCSQALSIFLHDPISLAIATEASSHPSGLISLVHQPYNYAGGGLGNIQECPFVSCLAGSQDSIVVAHACVPLDCTALDLGSADWIATLKRIVSRNEQDKNDLDITNEYIRLHSTISELNQFLKTGWTCGEYTVPWKWWPTGMYQFLLGGLGLLTIIGTWYTTHKRPNNKDNHRNSHNNNNNNNNNAIAMDEEEKKEDHVMIHSCSQQKKDYFWMMAQHWNLYTNAAKLFHRRPATACLDGLRVLSILWIILGHVMAIQSSSGGGYSNPADFLPPRGMTTRLSGQWLFASRFAVDTFLVISGYLVVQGVLKVSQPSHLHNHSQTQTQKHYFRFVWQYITTIPKLLLARILRLLPLYFMLLGFWMYLAPHLGRGPFWYQWQALLQPCHDYGWTNLLFVNNFYPPGLSNTQTCFYHSWYLAVDVQLFLLAPLLIYQYQQHPKGAQYTTLILMLMSMALTGYLSYTRQWSINTFDGAAVVRFDVEGYAKPHIRAQAYLAGMGVAFLLPLSSQQWWTTSVSSWKHTVPMGLGIVTCIALTVITVTGAYAQRPCRNEEWPGVAKCGSTWSAMATALYTGTSRALWSVSVATIMMVCLQGHGGMVGQLLSHSVWTSLSHLTFGVYLVHPIVIFVWQLGSQEKESFQWIDFGMKFVAVTSMSFGLAAIFCMVIEFPLASIMQQQYTSGTKQNASKTSSAYEHLLQNVELESIQSQHYGSMKG